MKKYYLLSVLGVLAASFYPLKIGFQVISDVIRDGYVLRENYPKYVIPYTPISIAIILGVVLMPLIVKFGKRFSPVIASALSVVTFFVTEILFENLLVQTTVSITKTITERVPVKLEDWQMFMCYIPTEEISYEITTDETVKKTAVEILMGEYSPTFKIHFYIISIVLILAFLNCFYGFYQMLKDKNYSRLKPLICQSVSAALFLGLCIFACFTAFFRTGDIVVSPLSAFLMAVFFTVFGLTMGIYTSSFLTGRKKLFSVVIPSIVAALATLVMYIGEMFLLSGHLYRFGEGFLFNGLPFIVLAPIDILVVILSFVITYITLKVWGARPNMVLIGKFDAIAHQNAHQYVKYGFRFWHTLT